MKISKNNLPVQNLSFQGHKKTLDKKGEVEHSFYYLYDKAKYDCELELYKLEKDEKKNSYAVGEKIDSVPMPSGSVTKKINKPVGFAYRFKLTDKNSKKTSYAFDNGSVIGIFDGNKDNKYNIVLENRALVNKNGPMQLIMPDGYNPEKVNEALRAQNGINTVTRTHANKFGGDLEGIVSRLDEIEKEGIVRIVGTPFTKDSISSHKYWTENAYRIAPDFGKEAAFEKLQVELFKHGINWVADAALVNEGFGGVHVSELLRQGDNSFSKSMFNTFGRIEFGVLPNETKHARIKFVNAPFVVDADGKLSSKNPNYDKKKPTYIQFYDNRLVSDNQKASNEVFNTYDKKTTGNIFEITKHDDAVYPYNFEVDPAELKRNVERVSKTFGKVDIGNIDAIKSICDFSTFTVNTKSESGGIEVWDGNVDIPKLNFFSDEAVKDKGALAVRDYALNSGKYWTQKTANIQLSYLSQYIAENGGKLNVADAVSKKAIPASAKDVIDDEVINNVLNGNYKSRLLDDVDFKKYSVNDYMTKKAMDLPLETIPVATNLLGVLTSPYIAKKPNVEKELGVSRYDLYKMQNPNLPEKYSKSYTMTDNFYVESLVPVMQEVLSEVPNISKNGMVTDYGKFVISEIAPDLTKYLMLKSLALNSDVKVGNDGKTDYSNLKIDPSKPFVTVDKNGNFDFSNVKENEITIQSLGLPYKSDPEDEAIEVLKILDKGLESIPKAEIDDLKEKVSNRFAKRTLTDFKLAEMVLDRTEAGLGWRIDATKDIASIDDVRNGYADMEKTWDDVIGFWKQYNQTVLKENPHAYTTAEITDLASLFKIRNPLLYDEDFISGVDYSALVEKDQIQTLKSLKEKMAKSDFKLDELSTAEKEMHAEIKALESMQAKKNQNEFDYGKLSDLEKAVYEKARQARYEECHELMKDLKYLSEGDAEKKFLEETGITSVANYNFFFSLLPSFFVRSSIEDGKGSDTWAAKQSENHPLREKLDTGWGLNGVVGLVENIPGFLFQSPDDGVKNSYTFIGNHDKPRLLHGLALDMELFYSDFSSEEHKEIAKEILQKVDEDASQKTEVNFDKVSPHAIAVAYRLNQAFEEVLKNDKAALAAVKKAVGQLASGEFKGEKFDAAAFGTKPFELSVKSVLEQVEYNSTADKPNPIKNVKKLEANVLQNILEPAFDRYYSIYKLLITLPGSPTDFAGDKVGATGYESKAKNYHQQNRNPINWQWLNDENYSFVKEYFNKMSSISNLRNQPELSALNDGDTVTLPMRGSYIDQETNELKTYPWTRHQAFLRYNDKGSVVLTLHDNKGANVSNTEKMERSVNRIPAVDDIFETLILDTEYNNVKQGLKHGLEVGTQFKKYGDNSTEVYEICKVERNGKQYYCLKCFDKADKATRKELPITIQPEDLNTVILYKVN